MRSAIVFDMDGVLADTERLKFRAHRAAVEAVGGRLDADLYATEMGGAHEAVIRAFLAASGAETPGAERSGGATSGAETSRGDTWDEAVDRYEERFQDAYRHLLDTDLRPMAGARELLAACRDQGRRLALVTSSEGWMADIVLEELGIREAFEAVVTADDVREEKPHPEAYLRARKALRVPGAPRGEPEPEEGDAPAERAGPSMAAVEDTRAGIASASAAGLPVIAVRHDFNRDHPFEGAAAVVDSLAPAERFLALVDRVARAAPATPGPRSA